MVKVFWHNLLPEEIAKLLGSDLKRGLSQEMVRTVQSKSGKNRLPTEKHFSALKTFLDQFRNPLIYILLLAGIVTLVLKEYADSAVIFGAVVLNTVVGYLQEKKASKTLQALKRVVKHEARVLRDGILHITDYADLVPGDIFLLAPGDKIPADARIIEGHNLKINEMALTGEWLPAKKKTETIPRDTPLADRDNMVYMGTVVDDGKGKAIVTGTGLATEIGKIAKMVREEEEGETPLQKKLSRFSRFIGLVIGIIVFFIFVEGVITGNSYLEMFITSIAVAVAAIPEGLPVALTVILALGMQRILARGGLVRKLLSAETLGGTSIIASDKTCTLTEGKMAVAEISSLVDKRISQKEILKVALICCEAFVENPREAEEKWILRGRPTDKALLLAAAELGLIREDIMKKEEELDEIVFDSDRKYAAALHGIGKNKFSLYVLGAPEKLLSFSKIDIQKKRRIGKELERLAGKGYRIVAAAEKSLLKYDVSSQKLEKEIKDLNFLGLIALHDPLRKDAKEAVREVIRAGIKLIIVTGDHKLTVKNIAEELGFEIKEDNILEGKDLDLLSDKELDEKLDKIKIFARVEPKHKIRIVEAWQKRGEVVAMTGDGINDAPALKRADIGVGLGSGTEVAKETSDLILLDDNFHIIAYAVEEGRAILDNIRKVIVYLLTSSFSEVILIGGSLIAGLPLPLLPAQILWVNLVEDGLPDIALAFEPKENDLMEQKPKKRDFPLLNKEMKVIIFMIGLFTDLLLLGLFFWLLKGDNSLEYIRTVMFVALAVDSLLYVLSCKSLRKNIWQINILSNKFLIWSILGGISMLLIAVYLPPLQSLLKTVPLSFYDWLLVFGLSLFELILIEAVKWYFIKKKQI